MKERIRVYKEAMQDHNLFNEANIFSFDNVDYAEASITKILEDHSLDAVLTIDELLSVKTVKMAQQLDIAIPRDLKVIGFSNGQISKEFYPAVSSVDQHAEEMGALATGLLIDSIRNPDDIKTESKVVKSSLVERESSQIKKIIEYNKANN
jgi:LacI family transcriptional regulator